MTNEDEKINNLAENSAAQTRELSQKELDKLAEISATKTLRDAFRE